MFEILPQSSGALLAVRASGKLSVDDYEKILFPKLDELFKAHKKLNMLVVFDEDFACWSSPQAAWDDAKIGLEHPNDFDRIALVGAPQWVEWGMKLYSLFVKGKLRSFPAGQEADAFAWLGKPSDSEAAGLSR
jgi:hypothetical protein